MYQTKITRKGQTTIPRNIRHFLDVSRGKEIEWHIVRGMVVVDTAHTMKDPIRFLVGQTKLDLDMVKLTRTIREEL